MTEIRSVEADETRNVLAPRSTRRPSTELCIGWLEDKASMRMAKAAIDGVAAGQG
jgi:hypothetical protein